MIILVLCFIIITIFMLIAEYKDDIVQFHYWGIAGEVIGFIGAIIGIYYAQTDPTYAKIMATMFSVCWIGFIVSNIIKSVKKIKDNK